MKVTDGPYAEAREVIGGLFVIDAANYEEVVELSRDCPHLEFGEIARRFLPRIRRSLSVWSARSATFATSS